MKQIIKFKAFFLIAVFAFVSCKKDPINKQTAISSASLQFCQSSPGVGATAYDLDITLNNTFQFIKNYYYYYNDPWGYGNPFPNDYSDYTAISGKGIFMPFGEFNIYVTEYADTAALSEKILGSYISIFQGDNKSLLLLGSGSVNFKKLIRQGGGPFTGTFTVTSGSAKQCDPNIFTSLTPLDLTGNLDLTTNRVSLRIKGKVYF